MFDCFLGLQVPSGRRPAYAKHTGSCSVPCMTPSTTHSSRQHSPRMEYCLSDGGSGCLRIPCARLHSNRRIHPVPGGKQNTQWSTTCLQDLHTLLGWTRNELGNTRTSWSTTSLENPWSCLDFVRSQQSCEMTPFTCFSPQTDRGACLGW